MSVFTPDPESRSSRFRPIARWAGRVVRRYWMWGALLLFGVYLWQDIRPDVDLPEDGPRAPDFALTRMNGETFRLSEHRGEVVVLNVWATWCPPCRDEIPGFVELQREFRGKGVTFVGLSVDEDGLAAVRRFAQTQTLNYPQVASPEVAYRKYGRTTAVPRTFVIDRRGRIRYTHSGLFMPGRLQPMLDVLVAEPGPTG
jgi:peroxiredoxin